MSRIEALALMVAKFSGGFTPDSEAMRLCNPGLLRVFSPRTAQSAEGPYRVFNSWEAGFKALVYDIKTKCTGNSRSGLKTSSTLEELLRVFRILNHRKPVTFLRRALNDPVIDKATPLEYFICQ